MASNFPPSYDPTLRKSFACGNCNKVFSDTRTLGIHCTMTRNAACKQWQSGAAAANSTTSRRRTQAGTEQDSSEDRTGSEAMDNNDFRGDGFGPEDWETDSDDDTDFHPRPDRTFGRTGTFLDDIRLNDQFAEERNDCLYFPFDSEMDWGVAAWLSRSGMSMSVIDEFFRLEYVRLVIPSLKCELTDIPLEGSRQASVVLVCVWSSRKN